MPTNWDAPQAGPHGADLTDEFMEHHCTQGPQNLLTALRGMRRVCPRAHATPPADGFSGYTIDESTGVLAGDALVTAWNYWGSSCNELYGREDEPSDVDWRPIREIQAICDLMLRRRGLSPGLQEPIGLRRQG